MADLTAIILTKNEEINISECIMSIKDLAKRIIVIDSFSDDRTVEIAKSLGADVYQNKFVNHAMQFNWGLDNIIIDTKWVLRIDADERLTKDISEEINRETELHSNDDVNGFVMRFRVFFMNKFIKHGCTYPFRKLTVFKYGVGRVENKRMDEHTILSCGKSIELKNDALHYDFKDLNHWIAKHNWYSTKEMQDYFASIDLVNSTVFSDKNLLKKRKLKVGFYYKLPMFFRALLYFCYRYFFRLGFLDGKEGVIFHFLHAFWYRFLVDAKIYECKKTGKIYNETDDLKV